MEKFRARGHVRGRFLTLKPWQAVEIPPRPYLSVAKFIVTDWGITPTMTLGCRTGPPAYVAGGPVRQPCAKVDFIPPIGDCELGLSCFPFK
jgi:hypothetical protein